MKVYRFCSQAEFIKYMHGEVLTNTTVHNNRTNSIGFCFTTEAPHQAIHYLCGCVDTEVCMGLIFPDDYLTPAKGIYAAPAPAPVPHGSATVPCDSSQVPSQGIQTLASIDPTSIPRIEKDEYCTTSYSSRVSKLIEVHTYFHSSFPNKSECEDILQSLGYTRDEEKNHRIQ